MSAQDRMRKQLANRAQLMEYTCAPGGVELGRIIRHAVFVRIDLNRSAMHVLILPGLSNKDIVNEEAVVDQIAFEDKLIRISRLVFSDFNFCQIQSIRARPNLYGMPGDVFQKILKWSWGFPTTLHGVHRGQS